MLAEQLAGSQARERLRTACVVLASLAGMTGAARAICPDPVTAHVSWVAPASNASIPGGTQNVSLVVNARGTETLKDVTFYRGSTRLGIVKPTAPFPGSGESRQYTLVWTSVAPGTYTIDAVARASSSAPSPSCPDVTAVASRTFSVQPPNDAPSAAVTQPAGGAVFQGPAADIALAASATDGDGSVTKVDFLSGTSVLGTDTSAPYQFAWTDVPPGTYSISARATDNWGAVGTSAAISVKVNARPSVSLTSPANAAVINGPSGSIAFAATAADGDGTISKVEFLSGSTVVGTDTTSPYSATWSGVAPGTYSLSARATDNNGGVTTSAAVSIRVNALPTATVSSDPATANAPGVFTLSASAADADGSIAKVDFYSGSSLIGSDTSPPYSVMWSSVPAGTYSITARATDNNGQQGTSAALSVKVNTSPLTISFSQPVNGSVFPGPSASIPLAASIGGGGGPVSRVEFLSGGSVIATSNTPPYQATWNAVPSGTYSLSARAIDGAGAATTSPAVTVRVNKLPTTSVATNIAKAAAPAIFTLTATAADSDGSVAQVEYLANGVVVGTDAAAPFSFSWSNVPTGTYSVTARAKDNDGQSTTSAAISITVLDILVAPVAISPPNLAGTLAGSLPGAVAVTPKGESSYSIPVPVPPGTAGMAPSLSLDYKSQAGEGLLGLGWTIGGLSSVERCGKTVAQDGVQRPVKLQADDAFCLDGQRLVKASGTHGTNAAYRTEIDEFSLVESSGSDASLGPTQWKVRGKDGTILTYGATADSRVEAPGKTVVLKWALSKVEDRYGNYMQYQYFEDNASGQHYPSLVRFTGNAAASLVPYNAIRFEYESADRPDPWQGYVMGSKLQLLRRLSAIKVHVDTAADGSGGSLKRQLKVAYVESTTSGRSLVSSVSDCDGTGSCLPATRFGWTTRNTAHNTFSGPGSGTWGGPAVTFSLPEMTYGPKDGQLRGLVLPIDVNGDGKSDLVTNSAVDSTWRVCLSTGVAFNCAEWTAMSAKSNRVLSGDFNGDGKMDLVAPASSTFNAVGNCHFCLSTGAAFSCSSKPAYAYGFDANRYLIGDFNTDGRDDLLALGDPELAQKSYLCLSNGAGFEACTEYGTSAASFFQLMTDSFSGSVRLETPVADFNADGRPDVLYFHENPYPNPGRYAVALAGDSGYSSVPSAHSTVTGIWYPAGVDRLVDTNRDPYGSYADIHVGKQKTPETFEAQTCHFSGVQFICTTQAQSGTNLADPYNIADYDGDGRPDIRVGSNVGNILPNGDRVRPVGWIREDSNGTPLILKADFDGDGVVDHAYYTEQTASWSVQLVGKGSHPDLLAKVTNGLGHVTEVQYKGLYDATVYSPGSSAAYPQRDVHVGAPVVSLVRIDNAASASGTVWLETGYRYSDLRTDLLGRGSLGFATVTAEDKASHVLTVTTYSQSFPTIGMPLAVTSARAGGAVLSQASHTLKSFATVPGALHAYVRGTSTTARDLNNALLGTTSMRIGSALNGTDGIDAYGNVTNRTVTTTTGTKTYTEATTNVFENRAADWLLGLMTSSTTTKTAPDVSAVTRKVTATYDSKGNPSTRTVEPDNAALKVETVFTPNATYGTLMKRQLKWTDPATSVAMTRDIESMTYDPRYRYPETVTNAKGHVEERSYDPATGSTLTFTDVNGLVTTWAYDGWGRKAREQRPDKTATTWAWRNCVDTCDNFASQVAITRQWITIAGADQQTAVPTESFTDRLGRGVLTRTWDHAGAQVFADQEYEAKGHLQAASRPHTAAQRQAGKVGWKTYERDDLGRPIKIKTTKDGGAGTDDTTIAYNGWSMTTTNAKSQSRTEVSNPLGKVESVTDAEAKTTRYLHDPFGNLLRTTDPLGNQVTITYDTLGRKTRLADPDLGIWTYAVDPLGLTWRQTDAKQQKTDFTYDPLGRLVHRLEPDLDSWWVYDSGSKAVGRLSEAYTLKGDGSKDYQRLHSYDALGRPSQVIQRLDWDYTTLTTYDDFARPGTLTHTRNPRGGSGGASQRFSLGYDSAGALAQVNRGVAVLWKRLARGPDGRTTLEQVGGGLRTASMHNAYTARVSSITTGADDGAGGTTASHQSDSYTYDPLGNLTSRTQLAATAGSVFAETFGYDSRNRLASSQVWNQAQQLYAYDDLGNLKSKAQVGTYTYPNAGGVRPHAVASIAGTVAGVSNPVFTYDDNGNLKSGLNRSYTWSAANLPLAIERLASGSAVQRVGFVYGPERQRTRQQRQAMSGPTPGALQAVLTYAGGMEKELDYTAGLTKLRTYLPLGLGYLEEVFNGTAAQPADAAAPGERYFHKDRLGSLAVITDASGSVLQRLGYDAWGRRRQANGADDAWSSLGSLSNAHDDTGFTGEEQLDSLGLVHLNGRVYDPITARMASADPLVPGLNDPQAFNRYSYVLNNPARYTDPSGFEPDEDAQVVDVKGDKIPKYKGAPSGPGGSTLAAYGNSPAPRTFKVRLDPRTGSKIAKTVTVAMAGSTSEHLLSQGFGLGQSQTAAGAGDADLCIDCGSMQGLMPVVGAIPVGPGGEPYVSFDQLPTASKYILQNRTVDPVTGMVNLELPAGYTLVPAPSGGGALLVPPGWQAGDNRNIVRIQPPGTGSSNAGGYTNGYYIVTNQAGAPISIYNGAQLGRTAPGVHNPLGPVVPPGFSKPRGM